MGVLFCANALPFLPGPGRAAAWVNGATDWFNGLWYDWNVALPGAAVACGAAMLGLLAGAFVPAWRRRGQPVALFGLVLSAGLLPASFASSGWRQERLEPWSRRYSIRRAQPLLDALAHYRRRRGSYPAKLADLVPGYLPALPTPGTLGAGPFRYGRQDSVFSLSWAYPKALASIGCRYEVSYVPGRGTYAGNWFYPAGAPGWLVEVQETGPLPLPAPD
ncbi:hypothetical protein [Hymenobacter arizonensis]|uniref:hypothetical protein n=1 Tax=Hymenobacter arizonensis TaxID=1227077 RepID=UPI0011605BA3|nr:hypothetical protein [Hymenobacter arizonensis]